MTLEKSAEKRTEELLAELKFSSERTLSGITTGLEGVIFAIVHNP